MNQFLPHTFHIPVMGLGFTIDTPLKVARFGVSSVVSIVEDELLERMREFHSNKEHLLYTPIVNDHPEARAQRITAYLNLMDYIVKRQMAELKIQPFEPGYQIVKYFELLPDSSPTKILYNEMLSAEGSQQKILQQQLRNLIIAGDIDVNIMTKVDKINYTKVGDPLPPEYSDALSALKGFAQSQLSSSVVFSAGMNPRLYSYCEQFADFFPTEAAGPKKKIILKVSDYRSALIQGKFLAKKGLWISEFRIESGLNCGGHAFATDGLLLGPILEEFKENRKELVEELFAQCNQALAAKRLPLLKKIPTLKITVQGGIGTYEENKFLLSHYNLDSVGWGSPFLLVPEATNVDSETLEALARAKKEDYYLSHSSPLGVPFNNFRKSSSEVQRKIRIEKNRPGSPCYKKFLISNTEFTDKPICTASRQYQSLKIKQITESDLPSASKETAIQKVTEKDCLCEGLGAPALLKNNLSPARNLNAVTICPGPNLAYFSGTFSLREMVAHIYGKAEIRNNLPRPHVFINELQLYVNYLKNEIESSGNDWTNKKEKYFDLFKQNLEKGISYYRNFTQVFDEGSFILLDEFKSELANLKLTLNY